MKKALYHVLFMVIIMIIQFNCAEQPTETSSEVFLGYWHLPINPVPNFIPDTLTIVLEINEDNTFSLELNEPSEKKLYQSNGEWSADEDSIFLSSSECMLLDTTPSPDTLEPLADSICEQPIPLPHPQSVKEWTIKTESLKTLLLAFPINQSDIEQVLNILRVLTLKKKE